MPLLKQQLVDTEKAIKNILAAIEQGIFTAATKGRLDELEQRKSDIETSILQEQISKLVNFFILDYNNGVKIVYIL